MTVNEKIIEAVELYYEYLNFMECHIRTLTNRGIMNTFGAHVNYAYNALSNTKESFMLSQHCAFAGMADLMRRYTVYINKLFEIQKSFTWDLSLVVPENEYIGIMTPDTNTMLVLPTCITMDKDGFPLIDHIKHHSDGWVEMALGGLPDNTYVKYNAVTFIVLNNNLIQVDL